MAACVWQSHKKSQSIPVLRICHDLFEAARLRKDLSLERCRRKLRTLRFSRGFLAVEIAFLSLWGTWAFLSRPVPPPLSKWLEFFGFLALFSAVFLAWGAWYGRKTRREMAEWEELRRSLGH